MPVWKYRSIEEMPDVGAMNGGKPLGPRIGALRPFSRLAPPLGMPRGVMKFRSFEALAADRRGYENARIARIRAAGERKQ